MSKYDYRAAFLSGVILWSLLGVAALVCATPLCAVGAFMLAIVYAYLCWAN